MAVPALLANEPKVANALSKDDLEAEIVMPVVKGSFRKRTTP